MPADASVDVSGNVWLFAYGSLIWRPAPDVVGRPHVDAVLAGYERRFWQASPDHRGTPTEMGRVCTLAKCLGATCTGVAYDLGSECEPECADMLARLRLRECAGYVPVHERVDCVDGETRTAIVFIGDEANEYWKGPPPSADVSSADDEDDSRSWSIAATAAVIAKARGPSGTNVDYLHHLVHALREHGGVDAYVAALWRATRARLPDDYGHCCGDAAA